MVKNAKDGSEGGLYTDEHRKRVLEEMKTEGFSLEIQVYERMLENGWAATLNETYWNIDAKLSWKQQTEQYAERLSQFGVDVREMDLEATKDIQLKLGRFVDAELVLAVECKTRDRENWVLYTKEAEVNDKFGYLSRNERSVVTYLNQTHHEVRYSTDAVRQILATSHHSVARSRRYAIAGRSLFKNPTSFHSACQQVTDAVDFVATRRQFHTELNLEYWSSGGRRELGYWRVYPVIVFDGPLWEYTGKKAESRLLPLDYIEYQTERNGRGYSIDIVRWECFDKYLNVLNEEVSALGRLSS